ncbi:HAMP domain-containing protein [Ramlibacter sp. G-1-2-2]|uniref:Signal transduction histidine-protein kinase/phosphatase MprB n=1 Tax=Ramlibacter agri TaxID=2728837 RepID=A0A848H6C3_9BURK|nr:ATP-binding protein [Ramlibacter agri]NML44123.1 HAMP domain-containing protein [Ramlibacter agri]
MRLTLQRKFFLALTLLLLLLLTLFVASSRLALQHGIGPYVAEIELSRLDWLVANLQTAYAERGNNWQFLNDDPQAWHSAQMLGGREPRFRGEFHHGGPLPQGEGPHGFGPPRDFAGLPQLPASGALPMPPASGEQPRFIHPPPWAQPQLDVLPQHYAPPPPPGIHDDPRAGPNSVYSRLALVSADGKQVLAGRAADPDAMVKRPVLVQRRIVGWLALAPLEGVGSRTDQAFLARQSTILLATGLAGLVVALLLSIFMARRWLQRLGALATGARAVADGHLDAQVPVQGNDELAQLTHDFNAMAARLHAIEQSRQQWLADVAHELRTPITAMRAEIEALQDGVRRFEPATAHRLHGQVMRLGQLVADLRLVLHETHAADQLAWTEVHPLQVLREALELMQPRLQEGRIAVQGLEQLANPGPLMRGDAPRLSQVFTNLLENTVRYTHPGGQLLLAATTEPGEPPRLVLTLDDSAPGPTESDLPRLFERFFRGDASRARASGGSGLGLAICRAIVEAHGGRIHAQLSPLGGLRITLELPLA